MKVLTVVKPYDKPVNTLGASWVGIYLSNHLVNDPRVDQVGLVTKLNDYNLVNDNIVIHEVDVKPSSENKEMILKSIEIYNDNNYDIMHVHIGSLAVIKWMDKLIPDNINVVYTLHSPSMLGRSSFVYGPYGANLNNKSNYRIVAISDFMKNTWRKFTNYGSPINNLVTMYNGIVEFDDIKLVPWSNRSDYVVVCGRITPVKNTFNVLKSLDTYNIPTVYIGDGYTIDGSSYESEYYNKCKEILESSNNIKWYKSLSNHDVREEMSKAKAVVHITNIEACALVPLEALSVGTPVIYSKTDSVIEELNQDIDYNLVMSENIYDNKVGRYVDYTKKSRWSTRYRLIADACNEVLTGNYDTSYIKSYFDNHFSIDSMVDGYIKIYDDLINR